MNYALSCRGLSLLTGYLFGMFLTAEIVVKRKTGKSCAELGSGNPGMANVMTHLGFRAGITVLAGDIVKVIISVIIAWQLFCPAIGRIGIYYAGIGATIGHDFPIWRRFRGGKGVATSCSAYILYSPLYGIPSVILGGVTVLLTKYLSIGGIAIPVFFLLPSFFVYGREAGCLTLFMLALTLLKHLPDALRIRSGEAHKVDLIAKLHKK